MNDINTNRLPTAYVVDDDESIRALWRWLMESNGVAVRTFATATEFIESYRSGDAGCLVLDLKLPGMSGLELQEYLNSKGIEIPIVFVTGHGDVPAAVSALKGGAVDFIEKPFSHREVLSIIENALQRDAENREKRVRRSRIARPPRTLPHRARAGARRRTECKPIR